MRRNGMRLALGCRTQIFVFSKDWNSSSIVVIHNCCPSGEAPNASIIVGSSPIVNEIEPCFLTAEEIYQLPGVRLFRCG